MERFSVSACHFTLALAFLRRNKGRSVYMGGGRRAYRG
jgi:hypothetical protein